MSSDVAEQTAVAPNGHVQDPGQVTVDMAGGGKDLGMPTSSIRNHSYVVRGMGYVPESALNTGRFGRMFRKLSPYIPDEGRIDKVARTMSETGTDPEQAGEIPAGYTYLGQFIDHDITFDPASSLERQNDPDALTNFRTPRFDLDCLYGRGPADQPYMYVRTDKDPAPRFAIGEVAGSPTNERDLPRSRGIALIGDPRNDENVIVSQLQLTMMLFHNKVCDWLSDDMGAMFMEHRRGNEDVFDCAQRLVRWHYQWIVMHDFLPQILQTETLGDVMRRGPLTAGGEDATQMNLSFFRWRHQVYMPVEFAVAAYRFGHSMIRRGYALNAAVSRQIFVDRSALTDPLAHLGGFRPLPPGWQIEWNRYFPMRSSGDKLQMSRRIDRHLVLPLENMPPEQAEGIRNLAVRNLTRGARLGLPSGQDVARAVGVTALTDAELDLPDNGQAPLWYYVLQEAQVRSGGLRLGPVGSRIIAEVFCGMLMADPSSYLSNSPTWMPVLPTLEGRVGGFTMSDLIAFTGFGVPTS
ncbi:peroxidase family protein [Streptomyces sp. 4N509B]|uniref:peroxidase family protein n=1 Tax=Streptomyces sp. 4N509B TaxID=3457413 RepID=UPI003FCF6508